MFNRYICFCFLQLVLLHLEGRSQTSFKGLEHLFTEPSHYTCTYSAQAPAIDGDIHDTVWDKAPWSAAFSDIEGDKKPAPFLNTRVKMLWNDSCLFIAAQLEEPHVWARLKKRDDIVFHDNDFEVFVDPDNNTHQYFEIEVNALNTIFDLFLSKPYRNNSGALFSWNAPGLKSAVKVLGTLNKGDDTDKGWTVEMALPFRAVTVGNDVKVPKEGELWRINFSRVEWDCDVKDGKYRKKKDAAGKELPEHNWVWSPQGVVNMHYPERWGYLHFSRKQGAAFQLPYTEKQRKYLWLVYYRQKEYFEKNKKYAPALKELGIDEKIEIDGRSNIIKLAASRTQFSARIKGESGRIIEINEEGLVQVTNDNDEQQKEFS